MSFLFQTKPLIQLTAACLLTALTWVITPSHAFDTLSEAQTWIYDTKHLSSTTPGQIITYQYTSQSNEEPAIDDVVNLTIVASHDDDRRDIKVDFLTEQRRLPLPPFSGFRGNPVIIAMLEHIAQSMSIQSGGNALYFRNRIRDAIASEDIDLGISKANYDGNELESTVITFSPFTQDAHLQANDVIRDAQFSIELSEGVPGSVLKVSVIAQNDSDYFERTLLLEPVVN